MFSESFEKTAGVQQVVGAVKEFGGKAVNAIKTRLPGAAEQAKGFAGSFGDRAKTMYNKAADGVKAMPGWQKGLAGGAAVGGAAGYVAGKKSNKE